MYGNTAIFFQDLASSTRRENIRRAIGPGASSRPSIVPGKDAFPKGPDAGSVVPLTNSIGYPKSYRNPLPARGAFRDF